MARRLRRLVLLAVIVGAITTAVRRQAAARRDLVPPRPPTWPPLHTDRPSSNDPSPPAAPAASVGEPDADTATSVAWAAPVDGSCPPGYPIKVGARSQIFHVPGGRSYDRTVPERCYASTDDAVADGYRAAKA